MNRTISPLDKVVRKVEKGSLPPPGYKPIYFDERSGEILKKEPSIFGGIGKKVGTYIVSVDDIVNCPGFSYLFDNGIGLNITYTAKCAHDQEEKILQELFDEDKGFETILNDKLKNYLRTFLEQHQNNITSGLLKNAEDDIARQCLSEIGLVVTPVISFQAEPNLKRLQVKSNSFSIRLQDYKETISMEYDIEIWPDENRLEKALLRIPSIDRLNNSIQEIIKNELWGKVTLNQFCLSLNVANEGFPIVAGKQTVKDTLIAPINKLLHEEGRKVGYLELSSVAIENIKPQNQLEIEHIYSYRIADENEKVGVKSRVSLRLFDIGVFKLAEEKYRIRKANSSVENWFKEEVIIPLIKDVLFEKTYKQILLRPDSIKKEIEASIISKANEIGYSVKLHTHLPDIKKLKLREGFTISMQDEEFETNSSDVKIKLNITIKGKVINLDELEERLLHPTVDIESEMKVAVRSVVEDEIHKMDPQRIYLRFSFTDIKREQPVDEVLNEKITEYLVDKFQVEEISLRNVIKLSQSEDEFIKKTKELRKELRKFDITVYPVSKDSYVEPLVFEIQYRILGIHEMSWSTFLSRISKEVTIQFTELENVLKALITERLNSIDYATLKSERKEVKDGIKYGISNLAEQEVAKKFGLLIEFFTVLRARSETEIIAINTSLERFKLEETALIEDKKNDIENMQEKVRILRKQEKEAIEREDLESAENFRQQIEQLKNRSGTIIPDVGNIRAQIEDSKSESDVLKDLFADVPKQIENNKSSDKLGKG